jgi:hypothetical protein
MRKTDGVERVRLRCEALLEEVRAVAARLRARLEELRRRFPEENLPEPQRDGHEVNESDAA